MSARLLSAPSPRAAVSVSSPLPTSAHHPGFDAVVCAGGGKSANRLLRGLDYELIAERLKPLVGVSDPSLLLNANTARTGLFTFRGPAVLWDFGAEEPRAATGASGCTIKGRAAAMRPDTGTAAVHWSPSRLRIGSVSVIRPVLVRRSC
ncbi:LD-carboxypeptidase [Streptomyces sp. NPDC048106]|uniref:LD-carboxypeptidase n=1 Tax=Streptomyces sp. NPDC048106 TaxID=3155750 RepID=UPI0034553915